MHTSFGERFRKERVKQKLTAEKIAKTCGVSRSYITLIENERRLPGRKIIPKMAIALNIKTVTVLNWYLEDINRKIKKDIKIS